MRSRETIELATDRCLHDMVEGTCAICAIANVPRCRWCNRPLEDAVSIWLGVGPVCFEHDKTAQRKVMFVDLPVDQARRVGPLPESSAKLWTSALRALPEVEALYRHETREKAGYYLYMQRRPPTAPANGSEAERG